MGYRGLGPHREGSFCSFPSYEKESEAMWQGHQASQGQVWKSPGIAPGPWFLLLPCFQPLFLGRFQWPGCHTAWHLGLMPSLWATLGSSCWSELIEEPSPALWLWWDFIIPPVLLGWAPGIAVQNCRVALGYLLSQRTGPPLRTEGEPGGEEAWGSPVCPASRPIPSAFTNFPKGQRQDKGQRELTLSNSLMILLQVKRNVSNKTTGDLL